MSRAYEVGGGDPWGDEFIGPDFQAFGFGAGDADTVEMLGSGGGDPWLLGGDVDVAVVWKDPTVSPSSELYSPSRYSSLDEYSQEGGWVLEARSAVPFEPGFYRVDFISEETTQGYPTDKPGCNSTRFGFSQRCFPNLDGRAIPFAAPAAPTGEYKVKLTFPNGGFVFASNTIHLVYVPESLQFRSMCRMPVRVYSPKNPIPRP